MDAVEIKLGAPAPDFRLASLDGRAYRLSEERGRLVIVNFWSAECPWVERVDLDLAPRLAGWGGRVQLWPIACNAGESLELIRRAVGERGLPLVLMDGDQRIANLYAAQATPHFFLIDGQGRLRYQGAYDDVTFRQRVANRAYLVEAVEALLAGQDPPVEGTSPVGCAIIRYLG